MAIFVQHYKYRIMCNYDDYKEIARTVTDNNLSFQKIDGYDKELLLQRLYDTFVIGNPRALCLSFRYVPQRIDCNMEDPYFHLPDIIDGDTELYFIIDYWNRDFIVYKAKMCDIHAFLGDCEAVIDEYYLVTPDFTELYGITDHDDLLYIDMQKNEMGTPASIR